MPFQHKVKVTRIVVFVGGLQARLSAVDSNDSLNRAEPSWTELMVWNEPGRTGPGRTSWASSRRPADCHYKIFLCKSCTYCKLRTPISV